MLYANSLPSIEEAHNEYSNKYGINQKLKILTCAINWHEKTGILTVSRDSDMIASSLSCSTDPAGNQLSETKICSVYASALSWSTVR